MSPLASALGTVDSGFSLNTFPRGGSVPTRVIESLFRAINQRGDESLESGAVSVKTEGD
jgi:hypothetical protein